MGVVGWYVGDNEYGGTYEKGGEGRRGEGRGGEGRRGEGRRGEGRVKDQVKRHFTQPQVPTNIAQSLSIKGRGSIPPKVRQGGNFLSMQTTRNTVQKFLSCTKQNMLCFLQLRKALLRSKHLKTSVPQAVYAQEFVSPA